MVGPGFDGTIRIWDPRRWRHTRTLAAHTGRVCALAATSAPNGRRVLASGGEDGTIRLWNIERNEPVVGELVGHSGPIGALAPTARSEGRQLVASGGDDGTVRIWDTSRHIQVADVRRRGAVTALTNWVGSLLAIGSADGLTVITQPREREPRQPTL